LRDINYLKTKLDLCIKISSIETKIPLQRLKNIACRLVPTGWKVFDNEYNVYDDKTPILALRKE